MPGTLTKTDLVNGTSSIAAGDSAAASGEWVEAVAIWARLLDTSDHVAASQRIRWFLSETATDARDARDARDAGAMCRAGRRRLLLVSVGCAVIGTACVFLGQDQTGLARSILAGLAWALYTATATLVVAYAFASGLPRRRETPALIASDLHRAHELARGLSSSEG